MSWSWKMIMTDRHHQIHDHESTKIQNPILASTVMTMMILSWSWRRTNLLLSWVVSTALFALNAPPTTLFFYEDINTTLISARGRGKSWANTFRAIFEHLLLILIINHPKFLSLIFIIFFISRVFLSMGWWLFNSFIQ